MYLFTGTTKHKHLMVKKQYIQYKGRVLYENIDQTLSNKIHGPIFKKKIAFDFCRFCVVIRFLSPPQRPMTSDFERFSIPDFIHYIHFPILILEKEPVFSLLNVQC